MSGEASKSNLQLEGLLFDERIKSSCWWYSILHGQALNDAEIKKMVQRQVQLCTTVFKQKWLRVNVTERGNIGHFLRELKQIIINKPVWVWWLLETGSHQQLYQ